MIDRDKFFAGCRSGKLFGSTLTQGQVDGMNTILDTWQLKQELTDVRKLAYYLATPFRETNRTMQPVREAYYLGEDSGRAESYRKTLRYYPFYGRGLVQLTWAANYEKAGSVLNLDLINNPDLAMEPEHSVEIMFRGMQDGWFGARLDTYFNDTTDDPVGARHTVNVQDHAQEIAATHYAFLQALS